MIAMSCVSLLAFQVQGTVMKWDISRIFQSWTFCKSFTAKSMKPSLYIELWPSVSYGDKYDQFQSLMTITTNVAFSHSLLEGLMAKYYVCSNSQKVSQRRHFVVFVSN